MADDSQTPLHKFKITVETATGGCVGTVIRAQSADEAKARALRAYPDSEIVGVAVISTGASDAPKVARLKPADRARREMVGILRGRGYSLADIAEALNITVERALVLMEAA